MASLLMLTGLANAGEKGGNGGGAWVCYAPNGDIKTAELLDLKEAETDPLNLTIARPGTPADAQLEERLRALAAHDPDTVAKMRQVLALLAQPGRWKPVDDSTRFQLAPPVDTALKVIRRERGCSLQGAANYDDSSDIVTYDPEIYAAMNPTDQAALRFHEAYYKVMRGAPFYAANSRFARRMTGAIFSDEGLSLIPPTQGIEYAQYECDAPGKYHFYIIPLLNTLVRMQFTEIAGRKPIEITYADLQITPNPTGDRQVIGQKVAAGLLQSTRKIPKTISWFKEWTTGQNDRNTFFYNAWMSTTSRFEPEYGLRLGAVDTQNGCNGSCGSHHWIFEPLYFHENAGVTLELSAGPANAGELVTCKKL